MFQRIDSLYHLESDNENEGRTLFIAKAKDSDLQGHSLGDPYFRDALLQSLQDMQRFDAGGYLAGFSRTSRQASDRVYLMSITRDGALLH